MNTGYEKTLRNGEVCSRSDIPLVPFDRFRDLIIRQTGKGRRLEALHPRKIDGGRFLLYSVLADDSEGIFSIMSAETGASYPALTPDCPQAHLYEREMYERWNLLPEGHPWLKPVRYLKSGGENLPGVTDYFRVEGDEIHEVAVGPVHAGIIEPGHFRFQCNGEHVIHLEISLGYQHRGIEDALLGGPTKRTPHYMETLAGDTTAGHTIAYCQAVEALAGCQVPERALVLRGIALELERLANHTGDLGALAGDVGYLPTASYCGRIRGDFLNMTALVCGNRFGRGWLRPGGAAFDIEPDRSAELARRLRQAQNALRGAVNLLWKTPSVMARFENTGILRPETCRSLGITGLPARACGLERDVRFNYPAGIFQFSHIPVSLGTTGDVFARAFVRWLEIERSIEFILGHLTRLPHGEIISKCEQPRPDSFVVSLSEGWRGGICHVAETGAEGKFSYYRIFDPSWHNWQGLAMAMRGQEISDFPLCNKSFNLSYCGHDL